VALRARQVRIAGAALDRYSAALPRDLARTAQAPRLPSCARTAEDRAAFVLTLDCINFGSGYWPHLRRRPGLSGYRTVEACWIERFERQGACSARELAALQGADLLRVLEQDPASAPIVELAELFAASLRELGGWLEREHSGRFLSPLERAGGSAGALVDELASLDTYRDVATYDGETVPFLKRAQITAHDLALALPEHTGFRDLDRLTLFADNLVPHVLRLDGVLVFAPDLVARIEREEPLAHGSPEEVEIRACAVHAVELLSAATGLPPRALDGWLWTRGAGPLYKARPRHRSPNRFY
jgi:hypothetical protein